MNCQGRKGCAWMKGRETRWGATASGETFKTRKTDEDLPTAQEVSERSSGKRNDIGDTNKCWNLP